MFFQVISLVGAACLLFAYMAIQLKRMSIEGPLYNFLNAFGSGLLAWVAIADRRWGFIILEVVWAAIALPPLYRFVTARLRSNG